MNTRLTPFDQKLQQSLLKDKITVLQVNLGRKCNLACNHCHVEASPKRTEELSPDVCHSIIKLIQQFPQIQTVDLTGGAPEMNYGFRPLVEAAKKANKKVIIRSNLTIFFEENYQDLPEYFAQHQLRVVASLPCYLENNVDKQRGYGVYQSSIKAIQILNNLGYGSEPNLILDLVYNPPIPCNMDFSLTPDQVQLMQDYKTFLKENFNIVFNQLLTITNLPIGRTKQYLESHQLYKPYLQFLEEHYNQNTLPNLMCRNQLSIDYLGNVYDCDFNQMENVPALTSEDHPITVDQLLKAGNLDTIKTVQTESYCYGCTAGKGSSCGGSLVN